MQHYEPLLADHFYHVYNRGINSCELFRNPESFRLFLMLYEKHVLPIAETYAWALIKNHYHFLLKIKDYPSEVTTKISSLKKKLPHQGISNLCNAFSKIANAKFGRHGALFERPFKRILINDDDYLRQAILYIHNNPVHHGICKNPEEYEWSSYRTYFSVNVPPLYKEIVKTWFSDFENFRFLHKQKSVFQFSEPE